MQRFPTVGLDSIRDAAAFDRIDTKFVMRDATALAVLGDLVGEYFVLDVDGMRFTAYRTQYFDTESFVLFRRHHAGGSNRYKVRTRTYLNTGESYIEIKRKTRRGATTKLRQRAEDFEAKLDADAHRFVEANCSIAIEQLFPTVLNSFDRICLVGKNARERLTIDLNIEVATPSGPIPLPGIAVAEFKQERNAHNLRDATFLKRMRSMNVRSSGFSKYCMCLLLTRGDIKHNLFKPQLKRLRRLMEDSNVDG